MTAAEYIDRAVPVRSEDALDVERLAPYLARELGTSVDDVLAIEQFPGGHSNLTYLVRTANAEYVLRKPPRGSKVKTAHDMAREFRILSKLAPVYDKAPRPLFICDDESILGGKFYLMERIRGVILRKQNPAGLSLPADRAHRLCEAVIDTLAELHALDYEAIGLGDLGRPAGYVERQVSGWTKRYAASKTDDIAAVDAIAQWLAEHMPADGEPALIHNDFKFDNLVLDPDDVSRVIGVLDWEMSTIGDARMDLGTALCYWIEAADPQPMQAIRFGPSHAPGMMTRQEVVEHYLAATGRDVGDIVFYYCFGLFKTAVVIQQIYYRFAQGLTHDPRFGQLIHGVRVLAEHAAACAERGSLSAS